MPPGPISEEHDLEARENYACQEDESVNVYTTDGCADVGVATPLHKSDLKPSPIDDSMIMADIDHDDLVGDFINDEELESSSEDRDESDEDSDNEDVSTDEDKLSH